MKTRILNIMAGAGLLISLTGCAGFWAAVDTPVEGPVTGAVVPDVVPVGVTVPDYGSTATPPPPPPVNPGPQQGPQPLMPLGGTGYGAPAGAVVPDYAPASGGEVVPDHAPVEVPVQSSPGAMRDV